MRRMNPWNSAFATDILSQDHWSGAKIWVFGHAHHTAEFKEGNIKVVSNQRGYVLPWSCYPKKNDEKGKFDVKKGYMGLIASQRGYFIAHLLIISAFKDTCLNWPLNYFLSANYFTLAWSYYTFSISCTSTSALLPCPSPSVKPAIFASDPSITAATSSRLGPLVSGYRKKMTVVSTASQTT